MPELISAGKLLRRFAADGCGHRARRSRASLRSARTRAEVISGESQMPPNRGKAAIRRVPTVQIPLAPPPSLAVAAISGEQREMAAFVARFERPTEPERKEYRSHSTLCASVSLRAGTGWFGFAIASAKTLGDPGCRCRGHRNEQAAYGWSNRSIRGRPLASGSSSPTAGRHAG